MDLAFDLLEKLAKQIVSAVNLNKQERKDFRDTIGGFAEEIDKGLTQVIHRIRGGITIASSTEKGRKEKLIHYQQETLLKLMEGFSEFKICQGLRDKRDHFEQLLHPAKFSVRLFKTNEVKDLLANLQSDEYVILEEVQSALGDLDRAARKSLRTYITAAEGHIERIEKRQKQIRRKARKVFEVH